MKEIPGISVILLDINMPKKDGLTFLKELNGMNNPTVKVVMVTAFGDMENIRAAMNGGAFDFLTKPIDFEVLEITIQKALKQVELVEEALKLRDEKIANDKELEDAARIQQAMLPHTFPPFPGHNEFSIYGKMIPAKKVGGDFYDFFFIDENRLALVIGDVSGKGISAVLYMVKSCTLLKTMASRIIHPGECLRMLNNRFFREKEKDSNISVTIFYGILNIKTGLVQYSCGGHPAPYVVRANGEVEQLPQVEEFPLAFFENCEYEVERIQLGKGDTIFSYTDGVTDAENTLGHGFDDGEKRLQTFLEGTHTASLEEIANRLITEINRFMGDEPQMDDITLLALRYN